MKFKYNFWVETEQNAPGIRYRTESQFYAKTKSVNIYFAA